MKKVLNIGGLVLLLTVAFSFPVQGNLAVAPACAEDECEPSPELICADEANPGNSVPHYCRPGDYWVLPGNCGDSGGGGGGGGGGGF